MMCVKPTNATQQELCCLMSEMEQLREDNCVFAGVVKQLQQDLSTKVSLSTLSVLL